MVANIRRGQDRALDEEHNHPQTFLWLIYNLFFLQSGGPVSETLQHVQVWTVNQNTCRQRYGSVLTDRMLCSGWLDVGGRDQCQGDSGGPLIHNGVIVGVCSWGAGCALAYYPGVNARVSSFTNWITTTVNSI